MAKIARPVHRVEVINFVEQNGPSSKADIIKFILGLKGRQYDPRRDRGWYCDAFWRPYGYSKPAALKQHKYGYLTYPTKKDKRYLVKNAEGKWAVKTAR